nr:hypothetical protein L203_00283 [Cryptococcus depauperatus CBS 7841]
MADQSLAIEPFLILARSTKGAAAAKVVLDVTAAPGVYVFSELMEMPNIQALASDPSTSGHYRLLELFAYGTLGDYEENKTGLPPLQEAHINKLKHLTLVSLALQHRSLKYDKLLLDLHLETTRQVEDLVIDAIYAGLLTGKLHHDTLTLHIDSVSGRDVRLEDVAKMQTCLQNWCTTAETLLGALDDRIADLRQAAINDQNEESSYKKRRDNTYLQVLQNSQNNKDQKRNLRELGNVASTWSTFDTLGVSTGQESSEMSNVEPKSGQEKIAGSRLLSALANVGSIGGALSGGRNNATRSASGRSDDAGVIAPASKRLRD